MKLLNRKVTYFALVIGLFAFIIFIIIMIKTRSNYQTCTYQDEFRKMTVNIPKEGGCLI